MLGKPPLRFPRVALKKSRLSHAYPSHHTAHLISDQLIPWLLAASLLFGLAMLTLALTAHT